MTTIDLTRLSAREISRLVKAREVNATEVLEAHLKVISRENPQINAICTLAEDFARAAARDVDEAVAAGRDAGPLAGVPIGIKDVTLTKGIRTTFGSELYADHVPTEDALVVERIKAAGAVIVGKTNTPEFAAGAHTVNRLFGVTRNPWNLALSASGSTGGGAAALASGMVALAEGSDLGGSLRTPAAFCGVAGLRPSPGLVPRAPSVTPWGTLSVAGPVARNVEDAALLLQVMAGPSPRSPLVVPTEGRDFVRAAASGIKAGLRVAYCPDTAKIGIDVEIERACRQAALELAAAGAAVEDIDLDLSFARPSFIRLRGQLMVDAHLERLDRLDKLNPILAGNIRLGLSQSPRDVAEGVRGQAQVFERFRAFFERYDCLLTPCAPVSPFPVEQSYPETINGQKMASYIDWVAPTFLVTLAGLPALSVPCGKTANGLPIGLQLVGPRWGEEMVLALGRMVEVAHPMGFPPSNAS